MLSHIAPSHAYIDLAAYRHNLEAVRRFTPEARILASVKADAYGHGLVPIARAAREAGVWGLGVATVNEGIALRNADIDGPIIVLFQPLEPAFDQILKHGLTLMLADLSTAQGLSAAAVRRGATARIHAHIDTGMGRQGFDPQQAFDRIPEVARLPRIELEGVGTHFPTAEAPQDPFTQSQIARFSQIVHELRKTGLDIPLVHAANSAAVVNFPEAAFDLVRPGIMTYGVWPVDTPRPESVLKPVMRWETHITQLRSLAAGHGVSYGRTYIAETDIKTAVLPVGYADGYRVAYSNKAHVIIHDQRCPVRGRVCMDQTVVEVGHLDSVAAGDLVTLLGETAHAAILAEELAAIAHTIPYEVLTAVGARAHRVYSG